jgi:hypothetical protein
MAPLARGSAHLAAASNAPEGENSAEGGRKTNIIFIDPSFQIEYYVYYW